MSYAKAWLKWFDVIEGGAAPLSARMIQLANLKRSHDVLDIGTGIGEPAVSVVLALDHDVRVLAIDRDPKVGALMRKAGHSPNALRTTPVINAATATSRSTAEAKGNSARNVSRIQLRDACASDRDGWAFGSLNSFSMKWAKTPVRSS